MREKDSSGSPSDENKKSSLLDEFSGDPSEFLKSIVTKQKKVDKEEPEINQNQVETPDFNEDYTSNGGLNNFPIDSTDEKEEESEKQEPTYTKSEIDALKKGWVPKDVYRGDPNSWLPAAQYLRMNSTIQQTKVRDLEIRSINKKLDDLTNILQTQSKIYAQERAVEVKKKLDEAVEERNLDEIRKYDKQYRDYTDTSSDTNKTVQSNQQNYIEQSQNADLPEEVTQFKARNKWFGDSSPMNHAMTVYAMKLDDELKNIHPEWTLSNRFKEVELSVKRDFGAFHNPNRDAPPPVEGKGFSRKKSEDNILFSDLSYDIQQIVEAVVDNSKGRITKEQCIKSYIKKGLIKV